MPQKGNQEICPYCGKPVGFLGVTWKSKKNYGYKPEWNGMRVHLMCGNNLFIEGRDQNFRTCNKCVYLKESHKFALETGLMPLPKYECGKLGIELTSSNMPKPNECPYHTLRKELFKQQTL
jgi:hypothetical protein